MDIPDQANRLLKVVHDLAPQVRSLSHEIETQRRLPQSLVNAMASAGLFRLLIPRSLGGLVVVNIAPGSWATALSTRLMNLHGCVPTDSRTFA